MLPRYFSHEERFYFNSMDLRGRVGTFWMTMSTLTYYAHVANKLCIISANISVEAIRSLPYHFIFSTGSHSPCICAGLMCVYLSVCFQLKERLHFRCSIKEGVWVEEELLTKRSDLGPSPADLKCGAPWSDLTATVRNWVVTGLLWGSNAIKGYESNL